ncbi:MAG: carbohydrate ABC transporter permease [Amnibacterium sp.]
MPAGPTTTVLEAPDGPVQDRRRPARTAARRRRNRLGLALVAPAFAVIAVLVLYPSLSSVLGSFQRYELTDPNRSFSGVRNYALVLADPTFLQSLANTAGYFVVITLAVLLMGLATALWLQSLHGAWRAVALTVVVLPWSVPGTVAGVLWSFILNPTGAGLLNSILKSLHLIGSYQAWLNKPFAGIVVIGLTSRGAPCPSASSCCSPASRASPARSTSRASWTARPGRGSSPPSPSPCCGPRSRSCC